MSPVTSWITVTFSRKFLHIAILLKLFRDCASYSPSINKQNLTGYDVLKASDYEPYIAQFNADDEELYKQATIRVLEDVFRAMLKKKYGSDEHFDVIVNSEKGDVEIWHTRTDRKSVV